MTSNGDPVSDPPQEPTLFEWAGGLPALTRMTRIFYGTYVPEDPLLAPLFADMAPDHPERVAAWLGETFGGPKVYSEQYGGYERMMSRHLGKALTEEQRARWVQLLCRSADDAGLPTDPEFRAAFVAYLEWGSRIAVENSQPGAQPPPHMPVPRWWWVCDATPRLPRLRAPQPAWSESAQELPGPGEPVSFEPHIKPLFREVTGARCASPSTSGHATTSRSTPRRSSNGSEQGHALRRRLARATGRGAPALGRVRPTRVGANRPTSRKDVSRPERRQRGWAFWRFT